MMDDVTSEPDHDRPASHLSTPLAHAPATTNADRTPQHSDHEVLPSVQKLTNDVQVAGVDGRFDQDVHHDGAQVWKIQPGVMPPRFRLLRWVIDSPGGDDLVGVGDGGAVCSQDVRRGLVRTDTPVTVVAFRPKVQRLAGHHDLEPISLVGQGEVSHETEARPSGRQHGLTKLLVG
jgi:hypothetical protein